MQNHPRSIEILKTAAKQVLQPTNHRHIRMSKNVVHGLPKKDDRDIAICKDPGQNIYSFFRYFFGLSPTDYVFSNIHGTLRQHIATG